jgi:hypothetical protein
MRRRRAEMWHTAHVDGPTRGEYSPLDSYFRATQPVEEPYDVIADPDEMVNPSSSPAHAGGLVRVRAAHDAWIVETGDLGAVPEATFAVSAP